MKQMITLTIIMCCLLLTACNDTSVGVIGGADGPTDIYVKGQFGEQDVYEPMLSSQASMNREDHFRTSHNRISADKWGLSLYADKVTNKGMTIKCEQFGGNPTGELQTGAWYKLETTVNDEWQDVKTKIDNPVWNSLAYGIKKNDITELEVDWEFLYGELSPGFYRLSKEVMDFREAGDYDVEVYQVHFTIE